MSIELIKARQKELAAAEAARIKAENDRTKAAQEAFEATGIPALMRALGSVQVPHWRGNGSRETAENKMMVSLSDHVKELTPTGLKLFDWDGEVKISWYVETTEKGAIWYRSGGRMGRPGDSYTPESLRDSFVDYMAKFLPPL